MNETYRTLHTSAPIRKDLIMLIMLKLPLVDAIEPRHQALPARQLLGVAMGFLLFLGRGGLLNG